MYYMIVQLPNGFIDQYEFEKLKDAINFQLNNKDCKFSNITTNKILHSED